MASQRGEEGRRNRGTICQRGTCPLVVGVAVGVGDPVGIMVRVAARHPYSSIFGILGNTLTTPTSRYGKRTTRAKRAWVPGHRVGGGY
jgi:hypothetical protein